MANLTESGFNKVEDEDGKDISKMWNYFITFEIWNK